MSLLINISSGNIAEGILYQVQGTPPPDNVLEWSEERTTDPANYDPPNTWDIVDSFERDDGAEWAMILAREKSAVDDGTGGWQLINGMYYREYTYAFSDLPNRTQLGGTQPVGYEFVLQSYEPIWAESDYIHPLPPDYITYNGSNYVSGEYFIGVTGVTNFTSNGDAWVTEASLLSQITIGYESEIYTGLFNDEAYFNQVVAGGDEIIYYFDNYTIEEFVQEKIEHGLLRIEWQNNTDLEKILFSTGWVDYWYLNGNLEKPEYPITIEGEEDGDGNINWNFKRYEKKSKLVIAGYEYVIDALTALPLMDNVKLYINDDEYIEMTDIEIEEPQWQENSLIALVTLKFTERLIIKRLNDNNLT